MERSRHALRQSHIEKAALRLKRQVTFPQVRNRSRPWRLASSTSRHVSNGHAVLLLAKETVRSDWVANGELLQTMDPLRSRPRITSQYFWGHQPPEEVQRKAEEQLRRKLRNPPPEGVQRTAEEKLRRKLDERDAHSEWDEKKDDES